MSAEATQAGARPIALRDPAQSNRAATWLELLFDLCFVVAVSALARTLHDDPSFAGLARFAGLFVPVWWAWMGYTWFATAWDNDDTTYRVAWFGAMLGVLWLAASIGQAAGGASTMFVIAYVALRLILIGLFARVRPAAPAQVRPFIERYLLGNGAGAVVWLASLAVHEPARYALWLIALGIEIGTPIWAVTTFRGQPYVPRIFHPGHIRERYGLFTLIVLGESILAVAAGTADIDWQPAGVATGVAGFALAAAIWWSYFGRVDSNALQLGARESFEWGYGHLLVYAGIAAVGVGIEIAIVTAADPSHAAHPGADRLVLGVGLATFLAGLAYVRWTTARTLRDPVVMGRLIGVVAALAVAVVPLPTIASVVVAAGLVWATVVLRGRSSDD